MHLPDQVVVVEVKFEALYGFQRDQSLFADILLYLV
jgi:hypothetical protein